MHPFFSRMARGSGGKVETLGGVLAKHHWGRPPPKMRNGEKDRKTLPEEREKRDPYCHSSKLKI